MARGPSQGTPFTGGMGSTTAAPQLARVNAAAAATTQGAAASGPVDQGPSVTTAHSQPAPAVAEAASESALAASAADGEQRWHTGFEVVKHGKRGKPKKRFVQLDKAQTMIQWSSQKNVKEAMITISDITEVRKGITTDVIRRYGKGEQAARYLSIIARSRTLDIEVETEQVRNNLVAGLNKVLHEQDPHS